MQQVGFWDHWLHQELLRHQGFTSRRAAAAQCNLMVDQVQLQVRLLVVGQVKCAREPVVIRPRQDLFLQHLPG
jgi:hypothetical protein